MGNNQLLVRGKRRGKFFFSYMRERMSGLNFSMVYVGDLQRNTAEYHGYSMTDAGDMKRMLRAVPVEPEKFAFLDVSFGKGMRMKCAAELGYGRQVFEQAGFRLFQEVKDRTRDTVTRIYHMPKREQV